MGFFDRPVHGGFDAMFDYNRDGVLDPCERAIQMDYIDREINGSDSFDEEDEIEEIQDEIEFMDREEAIEYIEDMGYDVDDFDFD